MERRRLADILHLGKSVMLCLKQLATRRRRSNSFQAELNPYLKKGSLKIENRLVVSQTVFCWVDWFSGCLSVYKRPLQKSLSFDSRNLNTGFRLFPHLIAPDFTQMPP